MTKKILTALFTILSILTNLVYGQNLEMYKIFTGQGKASDWKELVKNASKSDIVYFGEQHNDPICHWLQLKMAQELLTSSNQKLVLGAEMFESDNQRTMTEYLEGLISQKNFETEMRLWPNYKTDYKPIVEWAKSNKLKIIATNVPRRYANLVFRSGLEGLTSLSSDALNDCAPLPIEFDISLPGYSSMMDSSDPSHANENLPKAQAIKDATMAHFITKNLIKEGIFLHLNGAYHSDNREGILWYVNKYKPGLMQFTISTVSQDSLESLDQENLNKADFILVIPSDFTKTH